MVTMKDVAKAAGVSQAAVSYAYSGSTKVSPTQREQIFTTAVRLGYSGPSVAGSSLRRGRIGTVGVMVPGALASAVVDPSTALLLQGIVEVGAMSDVALTLLPVDGPALGAPEHHPVMPAALRGLVDGVVMHCLPNDHPAVTAVVSRGIPAVAVDSPRLPGIPYVSVDHRRAGAEQMAHVLNLGHRRIGIVSDRLTTVVSSRVRPFADVTNVNETYLRERLGGYRDAIEAVAPDTVEVHLVQASDITMVRGMTAARQLLEHSPTAIVATSDVHAVAAVKVLRSEHISVPEQVSVIGFDDAPIADLMDLTTLHQPLAEKGQAAATMLLDLLNKQSRRRSVKPTRLVVRSTTGPAR